jgi:hypothetical protein
MPTGNFFAGTFSRRPRVAALVDDTGLIPFSGGPTRTVAVLGISAGGQPKTPLIFANPIEAGRVLVSGELLQAVRLAFSPSTENNGASLVIGVRVNPAVQGALTLKDAAVIDSIVVTSIDYGGGANEIKLKVESGSVSGKKLTLAKGTSLFVKDNLARNAFSVQYIGAGTASTMTITGTLLTSTVTGGPGSETLSLDLNVYNTIQKVVDFIDSKVAYTAVVLDADPSNPTLQGLDGVTAVDIKTAVYTVKADLQAIVDWLNSGQQPLVSAVRAAVGVAPPANIPYTYLTGGGEGTTTNADWQAGFNAIQGSEVAFVVPVSPDAAIHAMADTHCHFMSADGKRPRRAFVGAALGEYSITLSAYVTRSQNLNSDRTALVPNGSKGYDADGNLTTFPPYITAAQIAGLHSGVPEIGDAITMRSIRASGLEWLPTVGELELGIAEALLMLEFAENRGFYRVTRGISTWRKSDAYHRVEISVGIALDEVVRRVVLDLEMFLGKKASPVTAYRILSRTQSTLIGLQRDNIIVGDAGHPAYRDITVDIDGDVARVQFACSPVLVLNFINVTINAETFSGRVSISVPS